MSLFESFLVGMFAVALIVLAFYIVRSARERRVRREALATLREAQSFVYGLQEGTRMVRVDGDRPYVDPDTALAAQKWAKEHYGYQGPIDGFLGQRTMEALQRAVADDALPTQFEHILPLTMAEEGRRQLALRDAQPAPRRMQVSLATKAAQHAK